jgi:hypothetical protein
MCRYMGKSFSDEEELEARLSSGFELRSSILLQFFGGENLEEISV